MKKDIDFLKAEHVLVAAIKEWDKDFTSQQWNIYIINNGSHALETVLVVSRGISEEQETATLRYNLKDLQPKESKKVEFIIEEVLSFTNEYLVTYFYENQLFEKNFTFEPHSISEKNVTSIPTISEKGILAK